MVQVHSILILSCLLATLLFCYVRIPPSEPTIIPSSSPPAAQTAVPTPACVGQPLYAVVVPDPFRSSFTVCQNGYAADLVLTCPPQTIYHPRWKRCERVDPCFDQEDGALITATASYLPKNRRYHVCWNRAILESRVCPNNTPYFDGNKCVFSDACSYLEEGFKYADQTDPTRYFQCLNKKAVSLACPPDHRFAITHCIVDSICENKDNGSLFVDPEDTSAYFKCIDGRSVKRKCQPNFIFSPRKRTCIAYNPCYGKLPDDILAIETHYLKRSSEAILCGHDEIDQRISCEHPQVYDEIKRTCRPPDNCLDLKPHKIYPHSESTFSTCENPTPQTVDIALKINLTLGKKMSRCLFVSNYTLFGPYHPNTRDYVQCQNQKALMFQCAPLHVFIQGRCQFQPCLTQPAGSFGPLINREGFYYCQKGFKETFKITCPVGTLLSDTAPWTCRPTTDPAPGRPPRLTSQYSFTDENDVAQSCREPNREETTIVRRLNPWLFRCQDHPCLASLIHNYAFVPMSTLSTGALCVEGRVQRTIDCGLDYFNLHKTLTGDVNLPDCVSKPDLPDETRRVTTDHGDDQSLTLYIPGKGSHMIQEDNFPSSLYTTAEPVYEGIERIVGSPPVLKEKPLYKCIGDAKRSNIRGYPELYYNCKKKEIEPCPPETISLGWKCEDGEVFPVFSDCRLFAIGRTRIYQDKTTRRLFQCPAARPIFNYLVKQCQASPLPTGQLLCEESYFRHFEIYARPDHQFTLPPVPRYSQLIEKSLNA